MASQKGMERNVRTSEGTDFRWDHGHVLQTKKSSAVGKEGEKTEDL